MIKRLDVTTESRRLRIQFQTEDKETHSFFSDNPVLLELAIEAFVKELQFQLIKGTHGRG